MSAPSTVRITRALEIDRARPIVRNGWQTGWSTDRIAGYAGISAAQVAKLAAEMGLPKRGKGWAK